MVAGRREGEKVWARLLRTTRSALTPRRQTWLSRTTTARFRATSTDKDTIIISSSTHVHDAAVVGVLRSRLGSKITTLGTPM